MPIRPNNYRIRPYSGPLGGQTSPGAGYANMYPGAQQPPQQGNAVPQAQNAPPAVPANQPGFVPPPNPQPLPQGNVVPQAQNAPPAVPANQPGFVPPPPQQGFPPPFTPVWPWSNPQQPQQPPQQGFPPPFTPVWPWSNPQQPQQPPPQGNAVPQAPDMPDWPPDSQLAFPATPGLGQAKWNDPATWDPSKGLPNVGDLYGGMQFDGTSWQPLPASDTSSPQWNSSMPDLPSPAAQPANTPPLSPFAARGFVSQGEADAFDAQRVANQPPNPSGFFGGLQQATGNLVNNIANRIPAAPANTIGVASAPYSRIPNTNTSNTLPAVLSNWRNWTR